MGNRAIVHFESDGEKHGIYLHWNGGPESVLAFLQVMVDRGWTRMDYASARFCGVVSEFFDASGDCSGNSLGIFYDSECGAGDDNGLYHVSFNGKSFDVTNRGRKVTVEKLDKDGEFKQYLGIVNLLSELRQLRKDRKT